MSRARRTLTLLPLLFAAPAAPAQESPAATAELPSARSIVDTFTKKSGYQEACKRSTSVRLWGKVEIVGTPLTGTIENCAAKPNLQRVSVKLSGLGSTESGHDGETAWSMQTGLGARILDGQERAQLLLSAAYDEPLKPASCYASLRTLGVEELEGRRCWKIELVAVGSGNGEDAETLALRTRHEFYDVETGLYAGAKLRKASPQGTFEITTTAAAYEWFGERLVPTEVRQKTAGQEVVVRIVGVEFDQVAADAFRVPEEIAALRAERESS